VKLVLATTLFSACAAGPESEVEETRAALTCAPLSPAQTQILKFEDASKWTPTFATVALSTVRTEGSFSLAVTPTSGYSTISSAAISTLPLTGRAITLDVRPPNPPVNPTWFGNVTGYLEAPSRGLSGSFSVYLGYQQIALGAPGVFQTRNFEIPQYAYDALKAGSYTDLRIRFAMALPEESAPYLFDNLTVNTCL
jgi:hypothetical protein